MGAQPFQLLDVESRAGCWSGGRILEAVGASAIRSDVQRPRFASRACARESADPCSGGATCGRAILLHLYAGVDDERLLCWTSSSGGSVFERLTRKD